MGWDDLFNGLALVCLISYTAVPAEPEANANPAFWKAEMASTLLMWTGLWLIKATFLALCWSIFYISASFRKAWWTATTYTFLTYWPIFSLALWQCGDPSQYADPFTCYTHDTSNTGIALSVAENAVALSLHLSTELLILALPLTFIWRLHMSRASKLSAAAVFSITIFAIAVGLLRNLATLFAYLGIEFDSSDYIGDITAVVEPAVAVIVCALPPYKVLLSRIRERKASGAGLRASAAPMEIAVPREGRSCQAFRTVDSITELERSHVI